MLRVEVAFMSSDHVKPAPSWRSKGCPNRPDEPARSLTKCHVALVTVFILLPSLRPPCAWRLRSRPLTRSHSQRRRRPVLGNLLPPSTAAGYYTCIRKRPVRSTAWANRLDALGALRALPVETTDGGVDASAHRKFYTLSATLAGDLRWEREHVLNGSNQQTSLRDGFVAERPGRFPHDRWRLLSGRYTLGVTYYYVNGPGSGSNGNGSVNEQIRP